MLKRYRDKKADRDRLLLNVNLGYQFTIGKNSGRYISHSASTSTMT